MLDHLKKSMGQNSQFVLTYILSDVDILKLAPSMNNRFEITLRYSNVSRRFNIMYDPLTDSANLDLNPQTLQSDNYYKPLMEEIVRILNSFKSHLRDNKLTDIGI